MRWRVIGSDMGIDRKSWEVIYSSESQWRAVECYVGCAEKWNEAVKSNIERRGVIRSDQKGWVMIGFSEK